MTTNTSPDNIPIPEGTDVVAPLQGHFASQAAATQAALLARSILAFANTASFPIASSVPLRLVLDQSTRWMYFSDGTKYYAAFPITISPIDGVTTPTQALAERRKMLVDEWVQAGDPGHSAGRIWVDLP